MDNNTSLHILTLNVQGIKDKNKQRRLFEWCKNQKADVTFIQETHLTPELFSSFDRKFNGKVLHSPGSSNSRGVAILLHSSFQHKLLNFVNDENGRYIIANIETDKECYTFVNIYGPNDQKDRNIFFKHVNDQTTQNSVRLNIVGGDFNEVLNTALDRRSRARVVPKKFYHEIMQK